MRWRLLLLLSLGCVAEPLRNASTSWAQKMTLGPTAKEQEFRRELLSALQMFEQKAPAFDECLSWVAREMINRLKYEGLDPQAVPSAASIAEWYGCPVGPNVGNFRVSSKGGLDPPVVIIRDFRDSDVYAELFTTATHMGSAIVNHGYNRQEHLVLVFTARAVDLEPIPRVVVPGESVLVRGRVLELFRSDRTMVRVNSVTVHAESDGRFEARIAAPEVRGEMRIEVGLPGGEVGLEKGAGMVQLRLHVGQPPTFPPMMEAR